MKQVSRFFDDEVKGNRNADFFAFNLSLRNGISNLGRIGSSFSEIQILNANLCPRVF